MTPQELANKIDYEGGIYDAIAGYGLNEESLDHATIEQHAIWDEVVFYAMSLRKAEDRMRELFPAECEEDDD